MSYVIDTGNNELRLEGDGFGASSLKRQLVAAPSGAKRMQIAFRYWIDTHNFANNKQTLKGWNHQNLFGLSFDGVIPKYTSTTPGDTSYRPANFFGWFNEGPHSGAIDSVNQYRGASMSGTDSSGTEVVDLCHLSGNIGGQIQQLAFADGTGGIFGPAYYQFGGVAGDVLFGVPASPTFGAKFTGFWDIWASALDKKMFFTGRVNFASLSGDAMFDAETDYWTYTAQPNSSYLVNTQFVGDVVSNWRPDFDTVVFPSWLMFRFSWPNQKFVFKTARIRYFDYDDNLLGTETLP